MKNLNLNLSLLLAILLLSLGNVNAQKDNSCSVQLENLDINLDVQEFFKQYFIEKKGNAKGDWATADLGTEIITEKDLQNKYYFEGDEKKKIAQRYYLKKYTEADKIVCYGNATFYTFEILATLDGKFVALTAKNHKIPTTSFKILLAELQKKAKQKKPNLKISSSIRSILEHTSFS